MIDTKRKECLAVFCAHFIFHESAILKTVTHRCVKTENCLIWSSCECFFSARVELSPLQSRGWCYTMRAIFRIGIALFIAPSCWCVCLIRCWWANATAECNCCTIDVVIGINAAISLILPWTTTTTTTKRAITVRVSSYPNERMSCFIHFSCAIFPCTFTTHICTLGEDRGNESHETSERIRMFRAQHRTHTLTHRPTIECPSHAHIHLPTNTQSPIYRWVCILFCGKLKRLKKVAADIFSLCIYYMYGGTFFPVHFVLCVWY